MKTVLVVATLVALAAAGAIPERHDFETKSVDAKFVDYQKKVFYLFQHITQVDFNAEYYKIGKEYDIEANFEHYTNKKAVEEFLLYFRHGMLPRHQVFSIFYERMREEAIALYHLFYFAKDFETFYKTACWARVHLNEGMFTYSFSIALKHRTDTKELILPAPYEVYPYFFVNADVIGKMYRTKMMEGKIDEKLAYYYGITHQDNVFTVYANYSSYHTYDNEDQRLSYFTEDIGLNTYYYYFHTSMPFWMKGDDFAVPKERRGEYYYYFHQQLLARYYLERLTNGLGEIPEFSWRFPIKTGYEPNMVYHNMMPFVQRDDYYHVQTPKNVEALKFVESFETRFFEILQRSAIYKGHNEVDITDEMEVFNFVGNYWQSNPDYFEKEGRKHYHQYYEILARVLFGAAAEPKDKHFVAPVALEHFATALRDPAFYQLYKRIIYYFLQFKQYFEPYSRESLHFTGVKINEVKVDRLVTYFDFFDFDGTNAVCYSNEEFTKIPYYFNIRQPRLTHKPFNVNVEIKSDVATDVIVKFFIAPKYNSNGLPISLEDNWQNFYELDYFKYSLVQGKNSIVRNCEDFFGFKDDSVPSWEILKMLDIGKVPEDMSEFYYNFPRRMMLPKGTKGGFPFQFFVMVYPYTAEKGLEPFKAYMLDNKPFGYPFDRPLNELYFHQPNMYFEDVFIYHKGEDYFYKYNIPGYKFTENEVRKH